MDRLIILAVIYFIALYLLGRMCKDCKTFKLYYVISLGSIAIVFIGCFTPINYVYTFALGYILLLLDFLLAKIKTGNMGKL